MRVSHCEALISSCLKDIDPGTEASFAIPATKYIADFYLPESKVLVEVNGPSHYIKKIDQETNSIIVTRDLNGRTLAKKNKI